MIILQDYRTRKLSVSEFLLYNLEKCINQSYFKHYFGFKLP